MPWFDRMKRKGQEPELPAELKDKTAEEVVLALQDAADTKKKLTELTAERTKEREQVTVLSSEFDKVKQKLAESDAARTRQQQQQQHQEEPADFLTDPEKAVDQRVAPYANLTISNAAMTARILALQNLDNEDMVSPSDAKSMNGRLFRAWEAEINDEAKKYPAVSMGQPQAWLGIYYLVKGRHADELANPDIRKKKYNFVESAAQGTPPPEPKPKDGVESLTDQEKHVADKMGVSYENYAKRKKGMQFVQG